MSIEITKCKKCGEYLIFPENWIRYHYERNQKLCKKCNALRIKKYYENNPKKLLLHNAKTRATKKNIQYSITQEDIFIPEFCPVFKTKLESGSVGNYNNSPSLDRVDPHLGYIPSNVIVISGRANFLKNNASSEEIRKIILWLERKSEEYSSNCGHENEFSDLEKKLLANAKERAKKQNVPFNIVLEDINVPSICPVLGIPLTKNNKKFAYNSPSIDKIIPKLGYIPKNIEVISFRANTLKNNATLNELKLLYYWMIV